jgi:uncharacterized coiled-coil protein SlyX
MTDQAVDLSEQITRLQILQMEQERSIESLGAELRLQMSRIEQLQRQLESLAGHLQSLRESLTAFEADKRPPPHY